MSLLVDLMTNTLDEEYAAAAARSRTVAAPADESGAPGIPDVPGTPGVPGASDPAGAGATERPGAWAGRRAGRHRGTVPAALALVLIGLVLATAVRQVHRAAPVAARTRAALVNEVQVRTAAVVGEERRVRGLTAAEERQRATALRATGVGAAVARQVSALELATGAVAVTGPAVRVRLDDAHAGGAAGGDPRADAATEGGKVLYTDLQDVVNALWAAGAEAVAVNGQRVTALTSIRSAGSAIVVDFHPVDPPYDVVALGNPDTLEPNFVGGGVAAQLRTYSQAYGLGFTVRRDGHATLPAATGLSLHVARPSPAPSRAPGGAPTVSSPGGSP